MMTFYADNQEMCTLKFLPCFLFFFTCNPMQPLHIKQTLMIQ